MVIPVYKFDSNNKLVSRFNSIAEAATFEHVNESSIRRRIQRNSCIDNFYYSTDADFKVPTDAIKDICKIEGLDPDKVSQIWIKTKNYSINQKFNTELSQKSIEESIISVLNSEELPKYEYTPTKSNKKTLINFTSDKHIGAKTVENSIYDNEWNKEEYYKRVMKVIESILEARSYHGKFDNLVLVDLGDMTDGYKEKTMRNDHRLPQNMTTEEQFEIGLKSAIHLAETLIEFNVANYYKFVFATNCNHSSVVDYTIAFAFKTYMDLRYGMMCDVEIYKKFIESFSIYNHNFMITHGKDSEDMKTGLPSTLDFKTEVYIDDYIRNFKLEGTNHLIKGDKHLSAEQYGKNFRYKNIPSLYGGSKWVSTNFGKSLAGFTNEIINEVNNRVITETYFFE